jgi:hypothetical protein
MVSDISPVLDMLNQFLVPTALLPRRGPPVTIREETKWTTVPDGILALLEIESYPC